VGSEVHEEPVVIAKLPAGAVTGIGSLPHLSPDEAAAFSLASCPELPFVPQLVRRHPAEGMVAQVLVSLPGFDLVGDRLVLDPNVFNASAEPEPDIGHAAFVGLRSFLRVARKHRGPVKWQLAGPVTVGMALLHHGVAPADAFDVALKAVRATARAMHTRIAADLPGCQQVAFIDEPSAAAVSSPGFPLSPDEAIDLISGALAALEGRAMAGIHCCADADLPALLATGPRILAIPMDSGVATLAGYLAPFLDAEGVIAWGAVPTDRPLAANPDRYWHELSSIWCALVNAGCDPVRLRRQSLLTPACGLAAHTVDQVAQIFALTSSVAVRVSEQAAATRLIVGA
jgi:hypothetical protein